LKLCSENGEPITDNHFLIQLASWNLQLLFSENGGPLTFNVVFISAQRKAGFVASWRKSASITSPDAPPGITSSRSEPHFHRRSFGASLPDEVGLASCRRQPCVPGCFSGHCDLAWSSPALRPGMFFAGIVLGNIKMY